MASAAHKFKILFVIHDMAVGGAQKQLVRTVNSLDRDQFEGDVACISAGGVNLEQLDAAAKVWVLGARKIYDPPGVSAALQLATIIRKGRYSIVEAYLPAAHLLSALALVGVKGTALVAARRQEARLDPAWMFALRGFLNRRTRFSIANSAAVKRSVVERYGVAPRRIAVIPNIVEPMRSRVSRLEARSRLSVSSRAFAVVAVGSISKVKDYPTILRAFRALAWLVDDSVLLVAGDVKCDGQVLRSVSQLGLDGRVRFLGCMEDVGPVLAAGDVFVHASKSEGLSNAVLEAMSAGLPLVLSDIPANREAADGCGSFFSPGDWRGCLQRMKEFAADKAAAERAGKMARQRVERLFNCDRIIKRRERLYRKLAEVTNDSAR